MSIFSNWSHLARAALNSAGIRIPLGQVHQILSAGLGHGSLASFSSRDVMALETAKYAVFDTERMQQRAGELKLQISTSQFLDAVKSIQKSHPNQWPYPVCLDNISLLINSLVSDGAYQDKQEIAKRLNGQLHNAQVFDCAFEGPMGNTQPSWKWRATGLLPVTCADADYEVSFVAVGVFPKLGFHLLGTGQVTQFAQEGDPLPYEADDVFEYDPYAVGN